jgi:hypothetical protein
MISRVATAIRIAIPLVVVTAIALAAEAGQRWGH